VLHHYLKQFDIVAGVGLHQFVFDWQVFLVEVLQTWFHIIHAVFQKLLSNYVHILASNNVWIRLSILKGNLFHCIISASFRHCWDQWPFLFFENFVILVFLCDCESEIIIIEWLLPTRVLLSVVQTRLFIFFERCARWRIWHQPYCRSICHVKGVCILLLNRWFLRELAQTLIVIHKHMEICISFLVWVSLFF
jgi:hypothetical protein